MEQGKRRTPTAWESIATGKALSPEARFRVSVVTAISMLLVQIYHVSEIAKDSEIGFLVLVPVFHAFSLAILLRAAFNLCKAPPSVVACEITLMNSAVWSTASGLFAVLLLATRAKLRTVELGAFVVWFPLLLHAVIHMIQACTAWLILENSRTQARVKKTK